MIDDCRSIVIQLRPCTSSWLGSHPSWRGCLLGYETTRKTHASFQLLVCAYIIVMLTQDHVSRYFNRMCIVLNVPHQINSFACFWLSCCSNLRRHLYVSDTCLWQYYMDVVVLRAQLFLDVSLLQFKSDRWNNTARPKSLLMTILCLASRRIGNACNIVLGHVIRLPRFFAFQHSHCLVRVDSQTVT